jgi:cell division protein FtsB
MVPLPKLTRPAARRRVRRRHPPSLTRRLSRYTNVFELCARLSVNGMLAVVSLTALSRLVPHIQTQAAELATVTQAVDAVEASTNQLKSDFGRYFDPSQAEKVMQEQSGYRPASQRQVVWTEPEAASKP